MLLLDLTAELAFRVLTLVLTAWAAHTIAHQYIGAILDAGRAYLIIVDLLYTQETLPGTLEN
jgi:hypothetical protein